MYINSFAKFLVIFVQKYFSFCKIKKKKKYNIPSKKVYFYALVELYLIIVFKLW